MLSVTLVSVLLVFSLLLAGFQEMPKRSSKTLSVQLLGINDFHGQLDQVRNVDNQPAGSAAFLAAHLREREKTNPHTLKVHAGDAVGASAPTSALLQDEPTIEILNALGFDVGTLGNHEFDRGIPEMMRLIKGGDHPNTGDFEGAKFPYTVANVVDKKKKNPILPPHVIKWVKGVPIAFVGAVTKTTPTLVTPDYVKDVIFEDEAEAINREVKKLKRKGVRTIIVLLHEGGTQDPETKEMKGPITDIAKRLDDEVDVVFAGHSHTFLQGTVDGKLVVQAYSFGTAFADVDLLIDRRTKDVISKTGEVVITHHGGIEPDDEVDAIVKRAQEKVAPLINQVVGQSAHAITRAANEAGESALGNLIADSQRAAMKTDFAFMNPGGIRADLPAGTVKWGDVYTVQPFGNNLVKMELTGAQIRALLNQQFQDENRIRILQISGLRYMYDPNRPAHDRVVTILREDGQPIEPNQTYTVTVNSFLASGGDGFTVLTEGTNRMGGPIDMDAMIEYIKQLPQPFSASIEGRIQLADGIGER